MTRHLPLALAALLLTAGLCTPALRAQPDSAPKPGQTWGSLTQQEYERLSVEERQQYQSVTAYGPHRPEDEQLRAELENKAKNTMSQTEMEEFKRLSASGETSPRLEELQQQALKYAGYLDGSAGTSRQMASSVGGLNVLFYEGQLMAAGLNAHAQMAEQQAQWLRDQIQVSQYVAQCSPGNTCKMVPGKDGEPPQGLMFFPDGSVSVMTAGQQTIPKSCAETPACNDNPEFKELAAKMIAQNQKEQGAGAGVNSLANNTPAPGGGDAPNLNQEHRDPNTNTPTLPDSGKNGEPQETPPPDNTQVADNVAKDFTDRNPSLTALAQNGTLPGVGRAGTRLAIDSGIGADPNLQSFQTINYSGMKALADQNAAYLVGGALDRAADNLDSVNVNNTGSAVHGTPRQPK